jgi:cytochrome c biogenesis factor
MAKANATGMINLGFLLFIILTSNPFTRTLPNFPIDGRDLNPMLQTEHDTNSQKYPCRSGPRT